MKTMIHIAVCALILSISCKKDSSPNPPEEEQVLGPFNIYGSQLCKESASVLVNHTGRKKVEFTVTMNAENQSPLFYLKKYGDGYLVYTLQRIGNDSTLWVWAESPDSYTCTPCKTGSGVDIKLETFKRLSEVSGNKYRFRFKPDGNATTIQAPGSAYLFYGDGIERGTKLCNRYIGLLVSGNDPGGYTKMLSEGDKIWDYNFMSTWFFKKKS
ncbi:MAG: hypothetical protein JNL51_07380 [Chitinophagaceae bacterium]|nr:hypothetical protein [Chitinophagaceae bacterium]